MNQTELEVWQTRLANDAKLNREQLMQDQFNQMTPEREKHLADLKKGISDRLDRKYRAGQKEHGGSVWERNPIKDMGGEITDLVVYYDCILIRDRKINELIVLARKALQVGNFIDAHAHLDLIYHMTYQQ